METSKLNELKRAKSCLFSVEQAEGQLSENEDASEQLEIVKPQT